MQIAANSVLYLARLHRFAFTARLRNQSFQQCAPMTLDGGIGLAVIRIAESRTLVTTNTERAHPAPTMPRFATVTGDGPLSVPNPNDLADEECGEAVRNKIFRLTPANIATVSRACARRLVAHSGTVLALPTDTVYGLTCLCSDEIAVNRIYRLKGRELVKPLAVCVDNIGVIDSVAFTQNIPSSLLDKLLPGPVTVVLERSHGLPNCVNPSNSSVGVRMIPLPFMRLFFDFLKEFLRADGRTSNEAVVALTSANKSGDTSTVSIKEFEHLWGDIDLIVDNSYGSTRSTESACDRQGSTVVDLRKTGAYKIIREGTNFAETVRTLENFKLRRIQ